jgi:hypothetical protein
MLEAVQPYAMTPGRVLAIWRIPDIPSVRSISMSVSRDSRSGMNMREKCTPTSCGTTRWAQGSMTVFTLGTTMPMRARLIWLLRSDSGMGIQSAEIN